MRPFNYYFFVITTLLYSAAITAQDSDVLMQLKINGGERTLSKIPIFMAEDMDLYNKYNLDADIRLYASEFGDGIITDDLFEQEEADLIIGEHSSNLMQRIIAANTRKTKAIGSTECIASSYVIGRKDATAPFNYEGKKIGVSSSRHTLTHFMANLLAKRKGLDPLHDLAIILNANSPEYLTNNEVDAIVFTDIPGAVAVQEGYTLLEDTGELNESVAGNSILASIDWIEATENQERAESFLKAIAEALVIIHSNKDATLNTIQKWYGITDPILLDALYERTRLLSKSPYICEEGIIRTLEIYSSNNTRRYEPDDFFDDRFVNELSQSGYFDSLYEED